MEEDPCNKIKKIDFRPFCGDVYLRFAWRSRLGNLFVFKDKRAFKGFENDAS